MLVVFECAIIHEPGALAAGKSGGVRLPTASETIHEKLKPLEASMKAREPVYVTGDTLTYDSKADVYTATGNAKAVERTTTLTADVITLYNRTQIHALGHVDLSDLDSDIVAKEGTLHLATEEVTLWNAKVYALNRSYYLTGSKLKRTLGQHYQAENALLTTCTCDSNKPDWSLTVKEMNLHVNGEMQGYSGDFDVLGHALIPLPFLEYNTDPNRHSGLLSPQFGYSGLRGAYLLQPYYFDLGPSQDATFAGDYESSARVGGLFEYRRTDGDNDYFQFTTSYYNESFRSESNRESDIVDPQIADPNIPINRWGIVGLMQEDLAPNLFAYGSATSSGDSRFFRQMNTPVLSSEYGWNTGTWQFTRNAVSSLGLMQEFNDSCLNLAGVWNQDLIQPQQFALKHCRALLGLDIKTLLMGSPILRTTVRR
ncbi:MAG TPA: LptA/OstA family protein [Candidatus Binataceae bacterium]|nr:LptA/OstA family protein [Candidatus Binataceae bacterium]